MKHCVIIDMQWSFRKTGMLASQSEIDVWVQAQTLAVLGVDVGGSRTLPLRVSGGIIPQIILRLCMQNLAI